MTQIVRDSSLRVKPAMTFIQHFAINTTFAVQFVRSDSKKPVMFM